MFSTECTLDSEKELSLSKSDTTRLQETESMSLVVPVIVLSCSYSRVPEAFNSCKKDRLQNE